MEIHYSWIALLIKQLPKECIVKTTSDTSRCGHNTKILLCYHVIATHVACSTNISDQHYVVEKRDLIEVTCSVQYRGNWMPNISCAPQTPGLVENTSSFTHVSYRSVIAAADIRNGTVIRCTTGFIQLEWKDESVLSTTPHPDVPDYDDVWTTQPILIVPNFTGRSWLLHFTIIVTIFVCRISL